MYKINKGQKTETSTNKDSSNQTLHNSHVVRKSRQIHMKTLHNGFRHTSQTIVALTVLKYWSELSSHPRNSRNFCRVNFQLRAQNLKIILAHISSTNNAITLRLLPF
jgi:hypothetical protein